METTLKTIIDQVAKEKGIEREIIIQTLEEALLSAAKKSFGIDREIEVKYNEEKADIEIFQIIKIVNRVVNPLQELSLRDAKKAGLTAELDDELLFQVFYKEEDRKKAKEQDFKFGHLLHFKSQNIEFGRIAARTAKYVISQKVREIEQENIFNEFKNRKGELIYGTLRRFEDGDIIVDIIKTEALLAKQEQAPNETHFRPGDKIIAYVLDIRKKNTGPQIILSRKVPELVIKLFEREVPEMRDGIVKIVAAARESSIRTKIAVVSRDSDVDPVGACVGPKGSRVQAIVDELHGEKIDIIPWNPDSIEFVRKAIAPAAVSRIDEYADTKTMEVIVPDDQLSIAIGKRGVNIKLASHLTGWKIEVLSESEKDRVVKEAYKGLQQIEGISENLAEALYKLGYQSIKEIAEVDFAELSGIAIIGEEKARLLQGAATKIIEQQQRERLSENRPLSERERLLHVKGIGETTISQLAKGKYNSVEDIFNETNLDKLALSTGIGLKKAIQLSSAVKVYLEEEKKLAEIKPEASEEAKVADSEASAPAASENSDKTVDENG